MLFLLHITDKNKWKKAKDEGLYEDVTLDTKGYIHSVEPKQLDNIIHTHFKGRENMEMLVIDPEKLDSKIKYEENKKGEMFPHIYGPINIDAIIKTIDFSTNINGDIEETKNITRQLIKD